MAFYLRFTTDARNDLRNGISYNNQGTVALSGLCGFSMDCWEYASEDEIKAEATRVADLMDRAYAYAGICEGWYTVFEGSYAGSNNDGVVFTPERILFTAKMDKYKN